MCDKEIDQLLLSPRFYHRARDVSMFLSRRRVQTDTTCTGKINIANNCVCHHGKDGCSVGRAHGFDIIRQVHSSRKDGSGFRLLMPSVASIVSYAEGK